MGSGIKRVRCGQARGRLASRRLHNGSTPAEGRYLGLFWYAPLIWNQASASPMRRTELLTKSRPHVATRDS